MQEIEAKEFDAVCLYWIVRMLEKYCNYNKVLFYAIEKEAVIFLPL